MGRDRVYASNRNHRKWGNRGSALLLVVITIGLLSLAAATAARSVTAEHRFLRHDLARAKALATAEAGIEYAIHYTTGVDENRCRDACEGEIAGQGSFLVQVAPADEAASFEWHDWLLSVDLLDNLVGLRLLGLPGPVYEWVAVSEGAVAGTRRVLLVHFTRDQHVLFWKEITP